MWILRNLVRMTITLEFEYDGKISIEQPRLGPKAPYFCTNT